MRHDNHARTRAILGAAWFGVAAMGACTSEQRERAAERTGERTGVQPGVQPERAPQPGPPPIPVDDVKHAPAKYYDKQVSLAGKVDKLYTDRAFELEGTGWAFDDDIVVLMKEQLSGKLGRDEELIVTGTVRRFTVADIERDLGWDLAPEIEVELRERPVLVADSVRRVGQAERARPDERGEQPPVNTVAAIITTKDPKQLSGQRVDLPRERVQAVHGKGLWIGPSAATQVFVVPTVVPKDLAPGDMVHASGTLKEVPQGAQEMWGLPADMANQLKDATVYIETATVQELPADKDERRH